MKLFSNAPGKVLSFLLFLSVFFVSCKKDSVSNPPVTTTDGHITVAYAQDSHYLRTDSLIYDNSGRIVTIHESTRDTAAGVISPLEDSSVYVFTFSGSNTVPASYTVTQSYSGTTYPAESHLLYYDGENRLTKDSILNGSTNSNVSFNYNYGNNLIAYNVYSNTDTGWMKTETDSVFTDASGNVANVIFYYYDYYSQPVAESSSAVYGSYVNPFYDKTLSKSAGLFLSQILSYDFISPKMFSSVSTIDQSVSPYTLNYTWTLDAKGRIIKGVEPNNESDYAFRYNN